MTTNQTNNSVILCGTVKGEPVYSHEVFGEKFYEVMLAVKRLSGMDDVLPVSVSEHLLGDGFRDGCEVTVKGQFRSYNKIVGERSKLMLTVFVRDVEPFDPTVNPNTMQLSGFICKPPVYRTTPFNREICDLLVAVNRQYNKSDYIPCIVWGRNARFAEKLAVGQHIALSGECNLETTRNVLTTIPWLRVQPTKCLSAKFPLPTTAPYRQRKQAKGTLPMV